MAQTGYTPILIYSSSTASQAPAAGNLTNSTLGSELAINITDGKLFYKDNANAIQVIAWKVTPTTAGGTGLTSYTAGDLLYYSTGTTLSKLGIGTAYYQLGVNAGGTAPEWQPSPTSVLTAQGDLLYASAANTLARLAKNTTATRYLANTGTSNNPAWSQIDLTNGVTGTLPTTNGGTGLSSFTANGVVYASSTSALLTGSSFVFTGTNVGIGTSSPNSQLQIYNSTTATARLTSGTSANFDFNCNATDVNIGSPNGVPLIFKTSNLDRGRFDTSGNFKVENGNFIVGTAGKGIDFSANSHASGMTSELMNWYEEGTWTPGYSGWTSNPTTSYAFYTRIGRTVTINMLCAEGVANTSSITGLPFTSNSLQGATAVIRGINNNGVGPSYGAISNSSTTIANIAPFIATGFYWTLSATYIV